MWRCYVRWCDEKRLKRVLSSIGFHLVSGRVTSHNEDAAPAIERFPQDSVEKPSRKTSACQDEEGRNIRAKENSFFLTRCSLSATVLPKKAFQFQVAWIVSSQGVHSLWQCPCGKAQENPRCLRNLAMSTHNSKRVSATMLPTRKLDGKHYRSLGEATKVTGHVCTNVYVDHNIHLTMYI